MTNPFTPTIRLIPALALAACAILFRHASPEHADTVRLAGLIAAIVVFVQGAYLIAALHSARRPMQRRAG